MSSDPNNSTDVQSFVQTLKYEQKRSHNFILKCRYWSWNISAETTSEVAFECWCFVAGLCGVFWKTLANNWLLGITSTNSIHWTGLLDYVCAFWNMENNYLKKHMQFSLVQPSWTRHLYLDCWIKFSTPLIVCQWMTREQASNHFMVNYCPIIF